MLEEILNSGHSSPDTAVISNVLVFIHGDIEIKLYDSDGDELAHSTGTGATEHISYQFQAGDTAPFFLDVYKYSGFSDYSLDGSLS